MSTFRYNANPMGILIATVASLSTFHPEANPALQGDIYSLPKNCTQSDRDRVWANRNRAIYRMLGKIPTIAANSYRHRIGRRYNEPMPNAPDYASNVFFMIQKVFYAFLYVTNSSTLWTINRTQSFLLFSTNCLFYLRSMEVIAPLLRCATWSHPAWIRILRWRVLLLLSLARENAML